MKTKIPALLILGALTLAACDNPSSVESDKKATDEGLKKLQNAQPTPQFDYSQLRQTVIDVERAQAQGTQTTSFWFSRGAGGQGAPIGSCPSLGFPVPATAQLTNPDQYIGNSSTVAQAESTGVYTGDSTGTYVICVGSGGKPYIAYIEADVVTIGGPAEYRDGKIQQTGDPTVQVNTK